MRSWLQIFTAIAEMQPGDIDKLSPNEASLVRVVVDSIEKDNTMCLDSDAQVILNQALDKLSAKNSA